MQTPESALAPGPQCVGGYPVESPLGDDVFVVRAPWLPGGRGVLALQPAAAAADPEARAWFGLDADALGRLLHPAIARLLARGMHEGRPFVVTALAPGRPLPALLAEGGPLPAAVVAALLQQVADALATAHAGGLLHRELRASSIVVDEAATAPAATLVGFGLGRRSAPGAPAAHVMAPECEGPGAEAWDPRSDLHALGRVAAAMLGAGAESLAAVATTAAPTPLTTAAAAAPRPGAAPALPPGTPRALAAILAALLQPDPARRYAGAAALADDLRTLQRWRDAGDDTPWPPSVERGRDGRYAPAFVGRAGERRRLDEAWQRARDGLQLFGLAGPAGIGKSRLLAEAARGWPVSAVLVGQGRPPGHAVPWGLVAEAVAALAGHPAARARQAALREAAGADAALLLALVPALRPLLGDAAPRPLPLPEDRPRHVAALFVRVLEALCRAGAPAVLVFDDLQWADEASLGFLVKLVRRAPGARLLVLLAWCDDAPPADARLARLLDRLRVLAPLPCATLGPLDEEASRALLASMLGPIAPAVVDALVARVGGHPLQAVEQVRALVAAGALRRGEAGWTVDGDVRAAIARAVEGDDERLAQTVVPRLASLDASTREVLAIAAVAGRVAAPATLRRLLVHTAGIDRDAAARRVVEALDAAQAAGLLRPAPGGMAWSHALLREAQYGAVGALPRQALHRACVELLAAHGAPDDAAVLAHHAGLAGDAPVAFEAARLAGDAALRDGAPDDALAFYAQARRHGLALPPPAREAAEAGLAQAVVDAELAAGRLGAARHAFEPVWSRPGDPVALGETARAFAALLRRHGEAAAARAVVEAALGRLGERVPAGGWALARQLVVEGLRRLHDERRPPAAAATASRRGALLGELYGLLAQLLVRVDVLLAFGVQLRACNLVERDGDALARARAAAAHGALCGLLSMPTRGLRLMSAAAAAQRSLGAQQPLAHTLSQRMLTLLMQARWDECVDCGQQAAAAFELQDAPLERAIALRCLHYALAACGRWDEAVAVHTKLQRQAGRPGRRASGAWSVVLRADLPARHDASQLLADARAAAALCAGADDPLAQAALRRAEGRAAMALGRCAEAVQVFDAARALVLRHRLRVLPVADVLLDRVECLQRRAGGAHASAAGAACREAGRALREARLLLAGIPALLPWLLRLRAAQCRLQGRLAAAQALWGRAVAAAGEHRMPLQRGLALLAWAQALHVPSPPQAARLLAEAAEVLGLLGVHDDALPPRRADVRAGDGAPGVETARQAALAGIARRLAEQPDADALLACAAEAAVQLLNADRGIVFLREEAGAGEGDGAAVVRRAEAGSDAARAAPVAGAVVDHVVAGARGALLVDAGSPARGVLCVPLRHGDPVDGVLYVDRGGAGARFGEPELALLQALAALAAPLLRRLQSLAAARAEQARLQARVAEQDAALARAHDAAAAAEQARQAFLSGLGHEIRTPMHAIFGMTHLLMQTGLTARQADCLQKLDRSAQLLLGLFDHANPEAGGIEVESVPFALSEVLDPLLAVAGPAADAKGLRLVLAIAPALPSRLIGDPLRLTQVLFNLVGNALAFTEHGEVVVEFFDRPVGSGHHRLHVVVQDSGCGIRPALREHLFEPRAAAASGRGAPGGLALSRQFVRLMGGDLECRSEPGVGSRFAFDVPVLAEAGPASWPLQGRRVLLLTDHGPTRGAIADMLHGLGARCVACAELADALARLAPPDDEAAFDAVVVDVVLPPAALAPLAACPGRPPVLAYGAASADTIGAWTVLPRPATPWTLRRALEAARPAPVAEPATAATGHAAGPLDGMRVLLVEDNEINRDFAVEVLGEAGVRVTTAEDGAQALGRLAEQPFDLVLMDCQMPVMDGYEATRRLRETPAWQSLPVVAMTAFAMHGDRERALAAGMTDVITKPVRVPQLLALLARWSGRGGAAGAQSSAQPASGPASTGPTTSGAGIT